MKVWDWFVRRPAITASLVWALALVVALAIFTPWWRGRGHTTGDWLTVLGLGLAVLAALPVFVLILDRLRRPRVLLYVMPYRPGEAPKTPDDLPNPRLSRLQTVTVRALDPGPAVHLKVVVNNKGTARVEGGLFNVCVPSIHEVPEPTDGRLKKLLEPEWARELDPDLENDVECWLLAAERDFAPEHAIIMRLTIVFAQVGTSPIYLCLDGEPNHHRKTLVQVETWNAP